MSLTKTPSNSQQPSDTPRPGLNSGFPSPAEDFVEHQLDLNSHLVHNPTATFFARMSGNAMLDAGIHDGDLLIIDRSAHWREHSMAVCSFNGEFTVRFLKKRGAQWMLEGVNPDLPAIALGEGDELSVWGIVSHIIHKV